MRYGDIDADGHFVAWDWQHDSDKFILRSREIEAEKNRKPEQKSLLENDE